ncbi:MAG: SAM-dependent methyltransferase, partial [Candidatus Poribacteria bacterium]|nr:SAM-dependent methyltransferase [Candidatus Poribacteria bacterium]
LLWYKMLYREPIPFEARLKKMVLFWNKVQPTYAYSDSSKELYKQYSTPCPIGAIIAQYTQMDEAEFIFEPSAGNGLLLVGANPRITHVNEIDKSRKQSLEYQGFGRITSDNAAEPFPEMMHKVHDVVVTNPPFASWDDSKFDKERIIQKYFNKHRGLANHIRLEHLMAGLALYTMKDDGKAAIIIMGHVYFGDDGLFAKYRPFFNWLYRHYRVDDVINMNSYKLYNKQGAVTKTMLILIGGRKSKPSGVAPNKSEQPHLEDMVETFEDLWKQTKSHIKPNIDTIIKQLKTARTK